MQVLPAKVSSKLNMYFMLNAGQVPAEGRRTSCYAGGLQTYPVHGGSRRRRRRQRRRRPARRWWWCGLSSGPASSSPATQIYSATLPSASDSEGSLAGLGHAAARLGLLRAVLRAPTMAGRTARNQSKEYVPCQRSGLRGQDNFSCISQHALPAQPQLAGTILMQSVAFILPAAKPHHRQHGTVLDIQS